MRAQVLSGAALAAVLLGASPGPASASTYVALWSMNEQSGSTMVDSTGYGNHGTRFNVAVKQASPYTYGYRFNGSSSRVDVRHSPSLNPGTSAWRVGVSVKLPSTLSFGRYNLLQKGISSTPGGFYKIEIRGGVSAQAVGQPRCTFKGSAGTLRVASRRQIDDNAWHRVVCTRTSTAVSITVDGVATTKAGTVGRIANNSRLTIGYKPTGDDWFLGSLDEVRITRL